MLLLVNFVKWLCVLSFTVVSECMFFSAAIQCGSWNPTRTIGQVWPLPQYISTLKSTNVLNLTDFHFKITQETCDILEEAVKRYTELVRQTKSRSEGQDCEPRPDQWSLTEVRVQLTSPCEPWPHLGMDEHYELHVNSPGHETTAEVTSSSVWGALRGLETFSQLVYPSDMASPCLVINSTDILDFPRFPHRGLMLDTSRHFLALPVIYNILSAMETNKMNVFHWHIVDDQSFPYQSYTFPSLSDKGAYDPKKLIYSQEDVRNVIEFSRLRGIRVIPEFDSPGHTQSWGNGASKLLTPCYTNGTLNGEFGPIDPSRASNFKFVRALMEEVKIVFPDKFIHVGGDEVEYACWKSNPAINEFMKEKNISSYEGLEGYYIEQVLDVVNSVNASGIVWQEVFTHNDSLRADTVVHIWRDNRTQLLNNVTRDGKFALLSEGWYLDHINDQWQNFYKVDPGEFNGTRKQVDLVLGGEACMWGEMVDETNIVPRIWPRASAVAERLWASKKVTDIKAAEARLNEHVCRMKRRGVAAQPANGPGFCPY